MPNMSYCKFRNTLQALNDCYYTMGANVDDEEFTAREQLILLCETIIEEWGGFDFVAHNDDECEECEGRGCQECTIVLSDE